MLRPEVVEVISGVGPRGPAGKSVLNGSGSPSNNLGTDGEFYIDTTSHTLYGPKAAGVWPAGIQLQGPQGPQGVAGATGPTGPIIPSVSQIYQPTGSLEMWHPGALASSDSLANGVLFSFPITLTEVATFDRIGCNVQTAFFNSRIRLGIYHKQTIGGYLPGALLLDAGEVNSGTTGVKSITINQTLQPGVYWLAIASNANPVVRRHAIPAWYSIYFDSSFYSVLGYFTYAYGFPNPFPPPLAGTSQAGVFLRRAS